MNPLPLFRDSEVVEENTDRDVLTPRYTEEAVKFIDAHAAQPFFLYVAYSYPHDPARASARFRGRSGSAISAMPWRKSIGAPEKYWRRLSVTASITIRLLCSPAIMARGSRAAWVRSAAARVQRSKGARACPSSSAGAGAFRRER